MFASDGLVCCAVVDLVNIFSAESIVFELMDQELARTDDRVAACNGFLVILMSLLNGRCSIGRKARFAIVWA